jgi:CarD family transcriptional regulator
MAQKMAPSKVASKKAASKKPTARKDAHSSGAKTVKTKPAKRAVKTAAAKPQLQKHAGHAAAKASSHKAALKEALKAHAAPRHEAAASKAAKLAPMPPPAPTRPAAAGAARSMPAAVAKAASQKIIAPAASTPTPAPTQPAAAQPAVAQQPAEKAAAAAASVAAKKAVHQKHGFKVNEWIVYPAHGVGRIVAIEEQEIAGISLELFVITFEKDKMTLRVPTGKSGAVGMRKLAEEATVKKAIETLKGRARVKRTMWSRRAQEYEAKINSGDLIAIAEVVRDLYRSESQPEQSYSERQLYEAALDRMAREIAVVEKLDERGAVQRITEVLAKSARSRGLAAEAA